MISATVGKHLFFDQIDGHRKFNENADYRNKFRRVVGKDLCSHHSPQLFIYHQFENAVSILIFCHIASAVGHRDPDDRHI